MTRISGKSLVLVVGAGASSEVGLPLGSGLKSYIAKALDIRYEHGIRRTNGDGIVDDAMRALRAAKGGTLNVNDLYGAARRIAAAMPQAQSIDNFIDAHRDNNLIAACGKLAIVRAILEAEQRSKLYVDTRNSYNTLRFESVEDTWFNAFFQLLTENCHRNDLAARLSQVAVVTFNYDRCIEHFLYHSLQNYYGMSASDATEVLKSLEIFHPYGSVGPLDWETPRDGIEFGGSVDAQRLLRLSNRIRTFTEGVDPSLGESNSIRNALANTSRIVFLGFAFHKLNMQLLFEKPAGAKTPRKCHVYATSMGISSDDLRVIGAALVDSGNLRPEMMRLANEMRCAELLRTYWRSLSLT